MTPPHPTLDVISIGPPAAGATDELARHFSLSATVIETDESTDSTTFDWSRHAGAVNRVIDDAGGWVLLLREGEGVSAPLAREIERLAVDKPVAWAFRIPVSLQYCGEPLYRGTPRSGSEIRLFHGRRCRFLPKGPKRELQSRGTVIRVATPLERVLFTSAEAHAAECGRKGVPHSRPRQALLFLGRLWRDRRQLTRCTLRYHWIEAGWDRGRLSGES